MTGFIILVLAAAVLWLIVRRNEATDRLDRLEAAHPGAFHGYAGIDCWLEKRLRT